MTLSLVQLGVLFCEQILCGIMRRADPAWRWEWRILDLVCVIALFIALNRVGDDMGLPW